MALKSYRDLIVWQKAMDLSVEIYRIGESFPDDERFGLVSQVCRSSVSVVANIAEGFGREAKRDFVRFLRISQGSLKETETHLLLSARLGMIDDKAIECGLSLSAEIGKMLRSLIAKIEQEQI